MHRKPRRPAKRRTDGKGRHRLEERLSPIDRMLELMLRSISKVVIAR